MSRFDDFIDRNNEEADDFVQILDEIGVSVGLYSSKPQDPNVNEDIGFNTEVQDPEFIRTILVVIEPTGFASGSVNEGGKVSRTPYIGLTNYSHAEIDNIFRFKGKDYRVVSINRLSDFKIEYGLELLT